MDNQELIGRLSTHATYLLNPNAFSVDSAALSRLLVDAKIALKQADAEVVRLQAALDALEWEPGRGGPYCPRCHRTKRGGHRADCPVGIALNDTENV